MDTLIVQVTLITLRFVFIDVVINLNYYNYFTTVIQYTGGGMFKSYLNQ